MISNFKELQIVNPWHRNCPLKIGRSPQKEKFLFLMVSQFCHSGRDPESSFFNLDSRIHGNDDFCEIVNLEYSRKGRIDHENILKEEND
jgi:hypothetical protein